MSFQVMNGEFIGIMGSSGSGKTTFLKLYTKRDAESGDVTLAVRDNGIGVKPWDLPFIFEKGFTGDTKEKRKNSTGMGLYLAKQTADSLGIQIEIPEDYTEGFEIIFRFCKV
ncbi:ATP-binding protein [Anaerostipes sp.]|uniref:ATP-binding protein n=1 Tax=Anaerostipes sp. TaxID=1872530 RepID=UPI002ED43500